MSCSSSRDKLKSESSESVSESVVSSLNRILCKRWSGNAVTERRGIAADVEGVRKGAGTGPYYLIHCVIYQGFTLKYNGEYVRFITLSHFLFFFSLEKL